MGYCLCLHLADINRAIKSEAATLHNLPIPQRMGGKQKPPCIWQLVDGGDGKLSILQSP